MPGGCRNERQGLRRRGLPGGPRPPGLGGSPRIPGNASADRWMRAAMASLALAAVAVAFGIWAAVRTEYVPYIVLVDELNRPAAALAPEEITDWPDEVVRQQLSAFVRDWRSVSSDQAAMVGRLERIQYFLEQNSAADRKVVAWSQDRDTAPFELAKTRTVDVEIVAVNLVGGRTWLVEWNETPPEPRERKGGAAATSSGHVRAGPAHHPQRRHETREPPGHGDRGLRHREGPMSEGGQPEAASPAPAGAARRVAGSAGNPRRRGPAPRCGGRDRRPGHLRVHRRGRGTLRCRACGIRCRGRREPRRRPGRRNGGAGRRDRGDGRDRG